MKKLLIILLLFIVNNTNAQDIKRTAIWYFGENAGIDFNTTPPTALTDGQVNTIEGCASICDTNGNLLFYTDGRTVWNKYHDTMLNGFGLLGHPSSAQSALIIPKPETDSIFYVFTTSGNCDVSEINVKGNNGKGEVIYKNKKLVTTTGEKQTAVKHTNGLDYWLITHGAKNDLFYSFLITKDGISTCPIVSKIGTDMALQPNYNNQGTMKANPQGNKVAICLYAAYYVEVYDFNNTLGILSNIKILPTNGTSFGLEFSPNGNLLYIINLDKDLIQFDLSYNDVSQIQLSKKTIFTAPPNNCDKLQMGLDKKIYMSVADSSFIGVINKPNLNDSFCEFQLKGIKLNNMKSLYGLPDYVTSFFHQPSVDFKYNLDCKTNTIDFKGYDTINATTHKWYLAKGNKKDSASTKNTTYTFADTGNYTITFIASNGSITDTVIKTLFIHPKYSLNLGNDTIICSTPFTLNAGAGQFCYTWQDSSGNNIFEVTKSGKYHVKVVTPNHCTQFDTINITVAPPPAKPIITRNNDTLVSSTAQSYQWYKNNNTINGATQREYKITQNGGYIVETTDSNGCKSTSNNFSYIWVGIEKINAGQTFLVYPNSTNNVLFIDKPVGINTYLLKILDIQGKGLITKELFKETEEIDLTAVAEGIYLLQITINGKLQETHKLIISK